MRGKDIIDLLGMEGNIERKKKGREITGLTSEEKKCSITTRSEFAC
jgi:hypothetical protein